MTRPVAPPLSDADHQRLFQSDVLKSVSYNSVPSVGEHERPTAIILAGQPGAGKSKVADKAMTDLGGNAIVVDPDALRDIHPLVDKFRAESPYNWADDTHKDASQWAKELRGKAIEDRKNLVIDTTLGDGAKAVEMVQGLQKAGYNVEIRALATHRLESELGVDARFTGSYDRNQYGRFVPPAIRDSVYAQLPGNLDKVQQETQGAPIRIYNREGTKLYDTTENPDRVLPGAALTRAREERIADPKIAQGQNDGWSAQMRWHMNAEARLPAEGTPGHETGKLLLKERSELEILPGIAGNAKLAADNYDRVMRAQTPVSLSSPSLPSASSSSPAIAVATPVVPGPTPSTVDLSHAHPDMQALYAEIRRQLPGVPDHKALEATVAAKKDGGIENVGQLGQVRATDDKIFIVGKTDGHLAAVSLNTPPQQPASELAQQLAGTSPTTTNPQQTTQQAARL